MSDELPKLDYQRHPPAERQLERQRLVLLFVIFFSILTWLAAIWWLMRR